MYIHIGNKRIISGKKLVGIFNAATLKKSEDNLWILSKFNNNSETVVVDERNNIYESNVSSYTIMKRVEFGSDYVWRKNNE